MARKQAVPKAQQNCGNCYAFNPDPSDSGKGWCRLYPPTLLLTAPVGTEPYMTRKSEYPQMNTVDWCAQWKNA